MKLVTAIASLLLMTPPATNACLTDGTDTGTISANIIGIEVVEGCTYLLLENVETSLKSIDTAGFIAGRFNYIGLDPNMNSYQSMLTIASMSLATDEKIYAYVTSRLAKASKLSISKSNNNNQ